MSGCLLNPPSMANRLKGPFLQSAKARWPLTTGRARGSQVLSEDTWIQRPHTPQPHPKAAQTLASLSSTSILTPGPPGHLWKRAEEQQSSVTSRGWTGGEPPGPQSPYVPFSRLIWGLVQRPGFPPGRFPRKGRGAVSPLQVSVAQSLFGVLLGSSGEGRKGGEDAGT